jgi:hypothetical protein
MPEFYLITKNEIIKLFNSSKDLNAKTQVMIDVMARPYIERTAAQVIGDGLIEVGEALGRGIIVLGKALGTVALVVGKALWKEVNEPDKKNGKKKSSPNSATKKED